MALIADTTAARDSRVLFSTVVMGADVKPLMVTVPLLALKPVPMALPVITLVLTMAATLV